MLLHFAVIYNDKQTGIDEKGNQQKSCRRFLFNFCSTDWSLRCFDRLSSQEKLEAAIQTSIFNVECAYQCYVYQKNFKNIVFSVYNLYTIPCYIFLFSFSDLSHFEFEIGLIWKGSVQIIYNPGTDVYPVLCWIKCTKNEFKLTSKCSIGTLKQPLERLEM